MHTILCIDREKNYFANPDELFEFKVMLFDLYNAAATFDDMIDTLLRGLKLSILFSQQRSFEFLKKALISSLALADLSRKYTQTRAVMELVLF